MPSLLVKYETRLHKREAFSNLEDGLPLQLDDANLKFFNTGIIKPFYGLTCITWINSKSELHQKLSAVQNSIQMKLVRASVGHIFSFLEPASFHMTICDIAAQSTPLTSSEIETVSFQIQDAFTENHNQETVTSQVRGLGLKSTITALVRFKQEDELQKVLKLENKVKQATQVNVRDFLGHITLAYYVKSPNNESNAIQEILQPYQGQNFGELSFSEFDLTYFTNMNTYLPLSTVNFASGQVRSHPINLEKILPEAFSS